MDPSSSLFPSINVSNVPFPRTSGARFCFVGNVYTWLRQFATFIVMQGLIVLGALIVFGRPAYLRRVKSSADNVTPRSLSALGEFLTQLAHDENLVRNLRILCIKDLFFNNLFSDFFSAQI